MNNVLFTVNERKHCMLIGVVGKDSTVTFACAAFGGLRVCLPPQKSAQDSSPPKVR